MSIAILTQVYEEMRRLAIAGSIVAPGDFRLKKLIAPLEKSGEKAPIFAKVAQTIQQVVDSTEKTASAALLELTSLVNAILYTQGETAVAGKIAKIESVDLGGEQLQTSARLLKPLLEALTSTGSGRLEIIKDAHERGAFRDLRLVKPALGALDDTYSEISDYVGRLILPIYGKAILPELKSKFDLKGKSGHLRRLSLMNALDPEGTRPIVKQVLEEGSKELKVVAIECLGGNEEDLSYLIEQSKAKAKDVRVAAFTALSKMGAKEAVESLKKVIQGADIGTLALHIAKSPSPEVHQFVLEQAKASFDSIFKTKEKKKQGEVVDRTLELFRCMQERTDSEAEDFVSQCFDRLSDLTKVKSEPSGTDLAECLTWLMSLGSKKCREKLFSQHELLTDSMLCDAFTAARRTLTPAKLYDMFAPTLEAPAAKGKKSKGAERLMNLSDLLNNDDDDGSHSYNWYLDRDRPAEKLPELDPRWLDLMVKLEQVETACGLARSGHPGLEKLLTKEFEASLKKKDRWNASNIVEGMIKANHPQTTDSVLRLLDAENKSANTWAGYWLGRLLVDLPKEAIPKLEEKLSTLSDKLVDQLMGYFLELKNKHAAATT